MAKSLVKQLEELQAVENPTDEQMAKIIELEDKIAKRAKKEEVQEVEAVESNYISKKMYEEVVNLVFKKLLVKPGYWQEEEEMQEKIKEAQKYDGLKPVINKPVQERTGLRMATISCKSRQCRLVEGIPVYKEYTDLFNEKQKKQYFK